MKNVEDIQIDFLTVNSMNEHTYKIGEIQKEALEVFRKMVSQFVSNQKNCFTLFPDDDNIKIYLMQINESLVMQAKGAEGDLILLCQICYKDSGQEIIADLLNATEGSNDFFKKRLESIKKERPTIITLLSEENFSHLSSLAMLADFQKCLAAAWIEHVEEKK